MHSMQSLVYFQLLSCCLGIITVQILSALCYFGTFFVYLGVPFFFHLILDQSLLKLFLFLFLPIFLVCRLVFKKLVEVPVLLFAVSLGFKSTLLHFSLFQGFFHHAGFLFSVFLGLCDSGVELIHGELLLRLELGQLLVGN